MPAIARMARSCKRALRIGVLRQERISPRCFFQERCGPGSCLQDAPRISAISSLILASAKASLHLPELASQPPSLSVARGRIHECLVLSSNGWLSFSAC